MTTLEDILYQLANSASSEREKGEKFERLMVQFFKTDLQWTDRFSEVWMWSDWPERHGRPDTGIDLVAVDPGLRKIGTGINANDDLECRTVIPE